MEKDFFDYTGLSEDAKNGVIGLPKGTPKYYGLTKAIAFIILISFLILQIIYL